MGGKKGVKGAEPERRIDPTDGKAYTRVEFERCYGGRDEWESAKRVGGNKTPSQPTEQPQQQQQQPQQQQQQAPVRTAPELRRDQSDGRVYTKQDFMDQYGGVKEWNSAERVAEKDAPERRIDPADNKFYTKADFVDQYGNSKEWDNAAKSSTKQQRPPPQQQQQQQQQRPQQAGKKGGGGGGKGDGKGSKKGGGSGPLPSDVEISDMCYSRHSLRKSRKYKEADELKVKLQRWGIRLDEDQQKWFGPQGRSGGYTAAPETRQRASDVKLPPDEEITDLCRQRAAFRKAKKFKEADDVKKQLISFGITLNDDNQEWHGPSGRCGVWATSNSGAGNEEMQKCFQKPDNISKLETFLTQTTEGIDTPTKITILLALPMEIFWGLFVHSATARTWASETSVSLLKGSNSNQDAAARLVSRFALYKEDTAHRGMFTCRNYAQLFCSHNQLFCVNNLGIMATAANRIPLLKESVCSVLVSCHSFYTSPKKLGVLDTFLKTVDGECSDAIDSWYVW